MTGGTASEYFGYDAQGSVRFLTSAARQVTDSYTYDAFGQQLNSQGSTSNRYRYSGEHFDDELGLYYLRARVHEPGLWPVFGTWIRSRAC